MPRLTPPDRLPKLLDAAAATFVEHGFQRTQMDDIAERLGISKGTIYRAVTSKDELFAAAVMWGDQPDHARAEGFREVGDLGAVARTVTAQLAEAVAGLELAAIVANRTRRRSDETFADEIRRITDGLYRLLHQRRTAVMMLDRCAVEIPELAAVWFGSGRYALVDLWASYLGLRARQVTRDVDHQILARTIVEVITTWAVKMHWDPAPRPYPPDAANACAAMVASLVIGCSR